MNHPLVRRKFRALLPPPPESESAGNVERVCRSLAVHNVAPLSPPLAKLAFRLFLTLFFSFSSSFASPLFLFSYVPRYFLSRSLSPRLYTLSSFSISACCVFLRIVFFLRPAFRSPHPPPPPPIFPSLYFFLIPSLASRSGWESGLDVRVPPQGDNYL